jgi:UDP-N-acetylenolpyruvoylglucosamine reductase
MARAATETQKAGLSGLEFGLAIPGTVGGAVWANAGAHDNDVAAVVDWADVLLADGTESRIAAADLGLTYRDSRFKAHPGDVVLAASFHLEPADAADDRRPPRRDPEVAPRPPAARDPVGRQRVPQPAGRLRGPADRRRRG